VQPTELKGMEVKLFDLTDKVAIVTGSSRGIGKAIAEALAAAGANVVISSRKQDSCEQVAAAINAQYGAGRAAAIAASISDKAQLQSLVSKTREIFGKIDVLVCNAATNPYYGPMSGISDELFRKILDNNVLSNHWLITMVAPEMIERKDGAIIVISSVAGLIGSDVIGAYSISKAADFQLVRNLAIEFGGSNVRINTIAPGIIRTDFARALWEDPKAQAEYLASIPLDRLGDPIDIAGAALFLASKAGGYVTGQSIVVDGGLTIKGPL
jgi:NAD(P)-dependent dehydrogenase (short-subunit alcohol dehydrogenase family)